MNRALEGSAQGEQLKLLFVCSAGLLRSATGAKAFIQQHNTRACGSHAYALIPITKHLIIWADKIFFAKQENYDKTLETFENQPGLCHLLHMKSQVCNISDDYDYDDPALHAEWLRQAVIPMRKGM